MEIDHKEIIEESNREYREMEEKDEHFEDLSVLYDESLEDDIIRMIKDDMPKGMFKNSALVMFGESWHHDVMEIVIHNEPALVEKLKGYLE